MLQAKSKNNKTYKNMVAVSNLYQYYWQTLNSLKVPTNKVTNQQYITQLVTNTINAELQYSPEVQQVTNGIKYELEFMANNKFILTTYTGNGNCIINVLPVCPLQKGYFFLAKNRQKNTCNFAGY